MRFLTAIAAGSDLIRAEGFVTAIAELALPACNRAAGRGQRHPVRSHGGSFSRWVGLGMCIPTAINIRLEPGGDIHKITGRRNADIAEVVGHVHLSDEVHHDAPDPYRIRCLRSRSMPAASIAVLISPSSSGGGNTAGSPSAFIHSSRHQPLV